MRGGKRKGSGRKPGVKTGSKPESRTIQKHYRVNKKELEKLENAAIIAGMPLSRYVAKSALSLADFLLTHRDI